MTRAKVRIVSLFVDGKAAKIIGTGPGWIVIQIGTARPIVLYQEEFSGEAKR